MFSTGEEPDRGGAGVGHAEAHVECGDGECAHHGESAERGARPHDDLLSDLIAVEASGDQLSEGEVIAVAIILFAARFETTTNLIGNGVGALLRHPEQMNMLWNERTLIPGAVEEMLRWDSPVQLDSRTALQPTEFNGEPIEAGQQFVTLLGAANRDPARFTDPDRFDITRDEGTPLSFAAGIHHCLGANLARTEGHGVLRSLIERCASIELDGELRRRPRMTLQGYESVPISVTARQPPAAARLSVICRPNAADSGGFWRTKQHATVAKRLVAALVRTDRHPVKRTRNA